MGRTGVRKGVKMPSLAKAARRFSPGSPSGRPGDAPLGRRASPTKYLPADLPGKNREPRSNGPGVWLLWLPVYRQLHRLLSLLGEDRVLFTLRRKSPGVPLVVLGVLVPIHADLSDRVGLPSCGASSKPSNSHLSR